MNLEAYSSVHNRVVVSLDCFGFVLFLSKDFLMWTIGLPWWLSSKESACSAGDAEFNPGVRKSPEDRTGNPLQYPGLGNAMGRGAWLATVHRLATARYNRETQPPLLKSLLNLLQFCFCFMFWFLGP